ncbi:cell division protein FtsW, lipid II flippase [Lachnospiraceae bacterium XBB1006]|nr:cell division protein FtsW, lipid II flippase [Lachnospiraceae bacterium XBB1006]
MIQIIVQLSKIIMIFLIGLYTIEAFSSMRRKDPVIREQIIKRQRIFMYMLHFLGYMVMFTVQEDIKYILFYAVQVLVFSIFLTLYDLFYEKASGLVVNNMVILLMIGMLILTRLSFDNAMRQFAFMFGGMVMCTLVPFVIHKMTFLSKLTILFGILGIAALVAVLIYARVSYGAKLSISLGAVSIQPSEFVKITYVLFVAGMLYRDTSFRQVVITTIVAAIHVLVLVASRDLGSALIYFIAYMVITYVATKDIRYLLLIMVGGVLAAIGGYFLFSHVRIRVLAWKNPFAPGVIANEGCQVAQSLFAIGTGGFLGLGLYQGMPKTIPVVEQDFVFSAISEEMGLIFALCMLLICICCFMMFLNVAMQMRNQYYKLVALGLGCVYGFQVFLTVGGVTKFIPSTGVTLPLVSSGGSSLVSTVMIFSIIEGLYILREEEGEQIERKRRKRKDTRKKVTEK